MSKHPLDITGMLEQRGITLPPSSRKIVKTEHQNNRTQSKKQERSNKRKFMIRRESWDVLSSECREILCSRTWSDIDFNPMLDNLDDLTKLTAEWLRWAIPTYANGIKEGPIRDWLDGKFPDKEFHYVLVGEHLKHVKECRKKNKKSQGESSKSREADPVKVEATEEETVAETKETGERQIESPEKSVESKVLDSDVERKDPSKTSEIAGLEKDIKGLNDASDRLEMETSLLEETLKNLSKRDKEDNT